MNSGYIHRNIFLLFCSAMGKFIILCWALLPAVWAYDLNQLRQAHQLTISCENMLRTDGFVLHRQGLSLVEGERIPYPIDERSDTDGLWRLQSVGIDLQGNLSHQAHLLGHGDPLRTEDIAQLLREAQAQGHEVYPLQNLFPDFVHQELGQVIRDDLDCNCFNLALRLTGMLIPRGHTDETTFLKSLKSHYDIVPRGTLPRFGDIVAFWALGRLSSSKISFFLSHVGVFIDANIILHKNSRFDFEPLTFERLDDLFAPYYKSPRSSPEYLTVFHRPKRSITLRVPFRNGY
jgi:hypothetical protein